jgi:1-acyl-sn-glycerol-3-phosphate acyltransferase
VSTDEHRSAVRALTLLNPRLGYHRAAIVHAERIPESGGCVIVSNHGRLDFDSFILLRLMLRTRGRLVRLMADHLWFRVPLADRVFAAAGAVDGTRENALDLLGQGEAVLTYPGGVREIFGSRFRREHIDWRGRRGFAHVAITAGVPVIPVAGIGVNSGHIFVSSGRLLGTLLFRGLLRLGPEYADYRDPLTIGLLPIPLPFGIAVSLPLPCRVTYVVGEPLLPPAIPVGTEVPPQAVEDFAELVAGSLRGLIREHGRPREESASD